MYQEKPPLTEMGYIFCSQWPKESTGTLHHKITGHTKATDYFPQPDGMILLLKTLVTYAIGREEIKLVPNQKFTSPD